MVSCDYLRADSFSFFLHSWKAYFKIASFHRVTDNKLKVLKDFEHLNYMITLNKSFTLITDLFDHLDSQKNVKGQTQVS